MLQQVKFKIKFKFVWKMAAMAAQIYLIQFKINLLPVVDSLPPQRCVCCCHNFCCCRCYCLLHMWKRWNAEMWKFIYTIYVIFGLWQAVSELHAAKSVQAASTLHFPNINLSICTFRIRINTSICRTYDNANICVWGCMYSVHTARRHTFEIPRRTVGRATLSSQQREGSRTWRIVAFRELLVGGGEILTKFQQ